MIIAGGCYREICERPKWSAFFGSGVRAAAALAGVTPHVELYTYCHPERTTGLDDIRDRGVIVHALPSANEIAFAYLHPLSCPGVAPNISNIASEEPIICRGDVVLRFGILEGDAVVHGDRVIYDPQTVDKVAPFNKNHSSAKSLAIVLNASELRASVPHETIANAAKSIMLRDNADVAIVKCGAKGAAVLEKGKSLTWVPAFRTPQVFKIGSGDIFSATFAHYWGVEERPAIDAAMLASQSTSAYCSSRELPIPNKGALPEFPPASCKDRLGICIIGAKNTLANHWLLEEALWCLKALGCRAHILEIECGYLNSLPSGTNSTLILADTLEENGAKCIEAVAACEMPSVILREREQLSVTPESTVATTNDFTTAIYWTAWI